ncbi:hypothetical protein ACFQZE_10915 [Paenibacillus sp. GCM10027627]|uniref:hypothetical protein n=1 Tax=unclassified Paenibacillus TaxID=185978 RepID=UPI00363B46DA
MDNELSNGIHIAINLMVISVVIGIILLFTSLGQSFGRGAIDGVADIQTASFATDLQEIEAYGPIPAASAYVLLQRNEAVVEKIIGHPYHLSFVKNNPSPLLHLMDKKVKFKVTESNGLYTVEIREEGAIDP